MAKLIVANWKLNPQSAAEAAALAAAIDSADAVVCPPFPFLQAVHEVLKQGTLGAQDVFWEEGGAYTGEVSAMMLKSVGVRYVIIGHSERRRLGETDEMVNAKVRAAQAAGLVVILCVGEPKEVRDQGLPAAQAFVGDQLAKDLAGVTGKVVVAYEPIWAIGTGVPDKPEETAVMAQFIREKSGAITVLYGGSVKPENAAGFLQLGEISGALVGGASLSAESFNQIIEAGR
ncbi:MAG TPA: triose-phosphate isomerase [Candidatus Paceibacterota bacterium]|nr:triose-phosphate isomerase [Candidatus Paceibacterota bacterium]